MTWTPGGWRRGAQCRPLRLLAAYEAQAKRRCGGGACQGMTEGARKPKQLVVSFTRHQERDCCPDAHERRKVVCISAPRKVVGIVKNAKSHQSVEIQGRPRTHRLRIGLERWSFPSGPPPRRRRSSGLRAPRATVAPSCPTLAACSAHRWTGNGRGSSRRGDGRCRGTCAGPSGDASRSGWCGSQHPAGRADAFEGV